MEHISIYEKMTRSEREVAEVLKNLGIKWSYEHPVFIWDENKRPRVWTPDFFLVQFGIYIEVCGSKDFNYDYRKKTYNENGYNVIFLHLYKESKKWTYHLIKSIETFIEYKINILSEIGEKHKNS